MIEEIIMKSVLKIFFLPALLCIMLTSNILLAMKEEIPQFEFWKSVQNASLLQVQNCKGINYCTLSDGGTLFHAFDALTDKEFATFNFPMGSYITTGYLNNEKSLFFFAGTIPYFSVDVKTGETKTTFNKNAFGFVQMRTDFEQCYFICMQQANPLDHKFIQVFDIKSGNFLREIETTYEGRWKSISVATNCSLLAMGKNNKKIVFWDFLKEENGVYSIDDAHEGSVNSVSFSPDNTHLLSASEDTTVKLWNIETKACDKVFNHGSPVLAVTWIPDGDYFASSSKECIKIWNIALECSVQTIPLYEELQESQDLEACITLFNQRLQFDSTGNFLSLQNPGSKTISIYRKSKN